MTGGAISFGFSWFVGCSFVCGFDFFHHLFDLFCRFGALLNWLRESVTDFCFSRHVGWIADVSQAHAQEVMRLSVTNVEVK